MQRYCGPEKGGKERARGREKEYKVKKIDRERESEIVRTKER